MIIVFIICAILYLIMMYCVISLYYTYRKDIEELEKRFKVVEKRLADFKKERIYEEDNIKENLNTCMDLIMNLANRVQKLERKKKSDINGKI